ncbi:MAG: tRNA-dihydrouridine synthase family protein [Lachnospiraceae bacterium]|nr:tRNA-dihydrouridine synthase family protein [Lachnospiraceae bacterium]
MQFYFAPMEGVTGYTLRNVHHACYPGMDRYFTPFISPNQHHAVNPKEHRDMVQSNNSGVPIVPQVLTNKSELFLWAARELKEKYGYTEVNLNLGCPSKTVVSKHKGSGFLEDTEKLNRFFDEVFTAVGAASSQTKPGEPDNSYPKISAKTRLGLDYVEEFADILQVYNQYPLSELIIHARVQKEFYKGEPHLESFGDAVRECKHSLCYNGDVWTLEDYKRIRTLFPTVEKIMIGRPMMANPELVQELKKYEECLNSGSMWTGYQISMEKLKRFHGRLLEGYIQQMNGDGNNVLFKMKELWGFLGRQFPEQEKLVKKLVKAGKLEEYERLAERLFEE